MIAETSIEQAASKVRNFVQNIAGNELNEVQAMLLVRGVLQWMREPTDLMGNHLPRDYRSGSHSASDIWRAMIDGAVAEADELLRRLYILQTRARLI